MVLRCVSITVVILLLSPSNYCSYLRTAPFSTKCEAKLSCICKLKTFSVNTGAGAYQSLTEIYIELNPSLCEPPFGYTVANISIVFFSFSDIDFRMSDAC